MKTKLLFLDLDGTLLTDGKEINKGDMDAIEKTISCGHKIIINSGRPLFSVMGLCEKFGFLRSGFYISSFNGGLIYDPETKVNLKYDTVDEDVVRYMFDRAYEMGLHAHTYTSDAVVSERATKELEFYIKRIYMPSLIVDDFRTATKGFPPKIIIVSLDGRDRLESYRVKNYEYTKDRLYCTFSDDRLLEYANPLANKGEAIRFMCRHLNVDIKNTVSAGDEENDLPMIETAHVGVCMKNGVDSIKKVADYVTKNTNNECGVKEIIDKFVL